MEEILEKLRAPFSADDVYWRVGSRTKDKARGMALAYIDARVVMRRLDGVLGPTNWQDEYRVVQAKESAIFVCTLSLRIGGEWIAKSDAAGETDVEGAKGGCSDAFKRAAVKWGIGQYLYDIESPWVELRDGMHIKDSEKAKLRRIAEGRAKRAVPTSEDEPKAPSGKISQEQRNELVRHNHAVLERFGHSKEEIAQMDPHPRFAPLGYALRQLGYEKLAEVDAEHFEKIKEGMDRWSAGDDSSGATSSESA